MQTDLFPLASRSDRTSALNSKCVRLAGSWKSVKTLGVEDGKNYRNVKSHLCRIIERKNNLKSKMNKVSCLESIFKATYKVCF